jgi:carboxyl-terminal processing protease
MPWRRWVLVACLVSMAFPIAWSQAAEEEEEDDDKSPPAATTKEDQYFEMMRIFADTFEQVERNYVKEIDRRKLIEAAIRGMVEELDPYSSYISPEDLPRFTVQIEQEFSGIGIQVAPDPRTHRLMVVSPVPGTPAYRAGVRAGDIIMDINGKSAEKMTVDDAVKVLKGKTGDEVTVGVLHQGDSKVEHLTMQRAIIHVATVQGDTYKPDDSWNFMLDPEKKIGYVRLSGFGRSSAKEVKEALVELTAQGMKGLILDLRFNPGGLLHAATEIADLFLEEGLIVSTKGRNSEARTVVARKPGTFSGFPMAILVNRYSASASEVVSAALQDHKRAVVIGERTWGKGSVQNVVDLEHGKSALKLTTASYHRPSGKNIHRFPDAKETDEWGVMPDEGFTVQFSNEEMAKYLEYRHKRDIITKEGPPKSDFSDRQLARALDFMTGQLSGEKKPDATAKAETEKPIEKAAGKSGEEKPKAGDSKPRNSTDTGTKDTSAEKSKEESSVREPDGRRRALPRQRMIFPGTAA